MSNSALEDFQQRVRAIEQDNDFPADFRQLLDRAVEINPDGGGFNFFDQGRSLNATEVRDTVYRLADGLQGMGVGKGSHVAVMLPNLVEFPLTWLALKGTGLPVQRRGGRFCDHSAAVPAGNRRYGNPSGTVI
jgi:crotonobetaine/carnitine-CoA ligase